MSDPDGDKINIIEKFGEASIFIILEKGILIMNVSSNIQPKAYTIKFTLIDDNKYPKKQTYSMVIEIKPQLIANKNNF